MSSQHRQKYTSQLQKCKSSHAKIIHNMKKLFLLILSIGLLFQPAAQSASLAQGSEPDSGAVVCAPDVYLTPPDDCLPTGPSVYLTGMAKLGLTFPPRSLPTYKPDPELTKLPYNYFHLDKVYVPVLSEPAGAESGQPIPPGFVYVSYVNRVDTGHGVYYMLPHGFLVRARVLARSQPIKGFNFIQRQRSHLGGRLNIYL